MAQGSAVSDPFGAQGRWLHEDVINEVMEALEAAALGTGGYVVEVRGVPRSGVSTVLAVVAARLARALDGVEIITGSVDSNGMFHAIDPRRVKSEEIANLGARGFAYLAPTLTLAGASSGAPLVALFGQAMQTLKVSRENHAKGLQYDHKPLSLLRQELASTAARRRIVLLLDLNGQSTMEAELLSQIIYYAAEYAGLLAIVGTPLLVATDDFGLCHHSVILDRLAAHTTQRWLECTPELARSLVVTAGYDIAEVQALVSALVRAGGLRRGEARRLLPNANILTPDYRDLGDTSARSPLNALFRQLDINLAQRVHALVGGGAASDAIQLIEVGAIEGSSFTAETVAACSALEPAVTTALLEALSEDGSVLEHHPDIETTAGSDITRYKFTSLWDWRTLRHRLKDQATIEAYGRALVATYDGRLHECAMQLYFVAIRAESQALIDLALTAMKEVRATNIDLHNRLLLAQTLELAALTPDSTHTRLAERLLHAIDREPKAASTFELAIAAYKLFHDAVSEPTESSIHAAFHALGLGDDLYDLDADSRETYLAEMRNFYADPSRVRGAEQESTLFALPRYLQLEADRSLTPEQTRTLISTAFARASELSDLTAVAILAKYIANKADAMWSRDVTEAAEQVALDYALLDREGGQLADRLVSLALNNGSRDSLDPPRLALKAFQLCAQATNADPDVLCRALAVFLLHWGEQSPPPEGFAEILLFAAKTFIGVPSTDPEMLSILYNRLVMDPDQLVPGLLSGSLPVYSAEEILSQVRSDLRLTPESTDLIAASAQERLLSYPVPELSQPTPEAVQQRAYRLAQLVTAANQ